MSSESASRGSTPRTEGSTARHEEGSVTVAELRVPASEIALEEAFRRAPSMTFRAEKVAGRQSDRPFAHGWIGGDAEATAAALEADPSVTLESVLVRRDDEQLCELGFSDPVALVADAVYNSGGTILSAEAADGNWQLCLRFSDRSSLSDLMGLFDRFGIDANLTQVANGDGASRQRLTEKQREALAAAHERGYFEVPRQASLEEVATDLGISHQAMSERLRRGQNALLHSEIVD